jgi:hypothetical protein
MERHTPKSISSHRFVTCLRLAMAHVLRTPMTPRILLLTIGLSLPLYLADYHQGLHPLSGFTLSLLLGAVLLAVAVTWPVHAEREPGETMRAVVLVLQHVGLPLAAFSALVAGAAWAWNHVLGSAMPRAVVELVTNAGSSSTKPLVHVVLGNFLAFIASPAVFLGISTSAPDRSLQERVDARPETPWNTVLPTVALLGVWGAWLLLAHVPVLGWLLVPVLAYTLRAYAAGTAPVK